MLYTKRIRAFLVLVAAMFAAGCEDLTGRLGGADYQVVVTGGGLVLAAAPVTGVVSGSISVGANAQRTITVSVLDRGNAPVVLGANDQIRVIIVSTPIATFQATGTANGAVIGTLRGVSTGSTSMRVQLLRGGTAEYESPSIPITVG
jgi:hypothetical protein